MWTNTWFDSLAATVAQLRFARRNPRFAAHFLRESRLVNRALRDYAQSGRLTATNIRKVGLKLCTHCNLRCPMCYQWRPSGLHQRVPEQSLTPADLRHVFTFLAQQPVDVVLWGGEPTAAPAFADIVDTIASMGCMTYICTNGTLLHKHFDLFRTHRHRIAFLIAIDGPEQVHDEIRGRGTYERVIENLRAIMAMRRRLRASWLVGVECTVMPENARLLEHLLHTMIVEGVDWMVFNHLWLVGGLAREEYSRFCRTVAGCEALSLSGFDVARGQAEYVKQLSHTLMRLRRRTAQIPVVCQPSLYGRELLAYYEGSLPRPRRYLKPGVKLDIEANGDVVAFKLFPDVVLGNIRDMSVASLLASDRYKRIARLVWSDGLRVCCSCPDYYNLRSRS